MSAGGCCARCTRPGSTASTPNGPNRRRSSGSARSSMTARIRASRSSAGSGSHGAAPRAMTPSPGGWRARRTRWASTSFRTAPSKALISKAESSWACARREASSARKRPGSSSPGIPACWPRWRASACQSSRWRCRRWSPSRSSR